MSRKTHAKLLSIILILAMMIAPTAKALNFTGELGNPQTFETLVEAHQSAPIEAPKIFGYEGRTFAGHPALDDYPENTTYVYRSANIYGGRAAARLNTNIIVFVDQSFESKDSALAYLKDAGLTDIIDEAIGSLVLVTPIDPEVGFGHADAQAYYKLQTAMLAQKDSIRIDDQITYYADPEYFGGYGYVYTIGIDGGATFFNEYIATTFDFVSRIAGTLLINGTAKEIRKPATYVPAYLVNAKDDVLEKYKVANETNAIKREGEIATYYNQAQPLQKVVAVKTDSVVLSEVIKAAYYNMFIKAMRVPTVYQAQHSIGTPYSGYNFDEAPYSLNNRNALINGVTEDGIHLITHQGDDDRFANIKMENGEYLDVWYEYLPTEVLDGSADNASIPLILANHGGDDDARVFVDEFGLLDLAGEERIAIVAPDHQTIADIRGPALAAIVEYMLEKYPALDPSRVYATGYSMGGGATYTVGGYAPQLFAAIAPSAGSPTDPSEEAIANMQKYDLPVHFSLSSYDPAGRRLTALEGDLNERSQQMITFWAAANGIDQSVYDFDTYPVVGFEGDVWVSETINNEYPTETWYLLNDVGEPRIAFAYIKGIIHCLYPGWSELMWDFVKDYSRDLATGEIVYNPYLR